MTAWIPGLFGKLPANGDFVQRGWSDATAGAVDRWLSIMVGRSLDLPEPERSTPWSEVFLPWRAFIPAGMLGPDALHLGIAPSTDRVGRRFMLAVGIAADAIVAWHHAITMGDVIVDAVNQAVVGGADADTVVAMLTEPMPECRRDDVPAASVWWQSIGGTPVFSSADIDTILLDRLHGRELT